MFSTRADVDQEIITAVENGAVEEAHSVFDIDAIAAECFTFDTEAGVFVQTVSTDQFWASVERNADE